MDWSSIRENLRLYSGRSRRINERLAAERKSRRQNQYSHKRSDTPTQRKSPLPAAGIPLSSPQQPLRDSEKYQREMSPVTEATETIHQNGTVQPRSEKQKEPAVNGDYRGTNDEDDDDDFDLKPRHRGRDTRPKAMDDLSMLLFSGEHLDTILHDPELVRTFNAFLSEYRPQLLPMVLRFRETQKAIKAVEYANAVAKKIPPQTSGSEENSASLAAHMDNAFQDLSGGVLETLITEALPAYITYNLVKVTTELLINDITGRQTPIMKGLVGGLSEIFCLTDPNQEDNPIIYASEDFYRMTGYSRDFIIGSNCRFLQGPKTQRHSVRRLRHASESGEELSETLLNYTRDGRPFLNILMIAPLHDNKGKVKYYIGAQVDASGLVEGGKGLDSFKQFLSDKEATKQQQSKGSEEKQDALTKLGELSRLFDLDEAGVVAERSRSSSRSRNSDARETSRGQAKQRRFFDESSERESDNGRTPDKTHDTEWSLAQTDSSGNLPGVYQNYFLMRPSPSLKIIFVSPALRKMGNLVQSPFLSHISAPPATLNGLKESFESGNPVTAKVLFSASGSGQEHGKELTDNESSKNLEDVASKQTGRLTWISASPLLGGDDEVGVWMVVVVQEPAVDAATRGDSMQGLTTSKMTSKLGHRINEGMGAEPDSPRSIETLKDPANFSTSTQHATKEAQEARPNGERVQSRQVSAESIKVGASAASPDQPSQGVTASNKGSPETLRTPVESNSKGYFDERQATAKDRSGFSTPQHNSTPKARNAEYGDSSEETPDEPDGEARESRGQRLPQSQTNFTPGKGIALDYMQHPGSGRRLTYANVGELGQEDGEKGQANTDEDAKTPFSID